MKEKRKEGRERGIRERRNFFPFIFLSFSFVAEAHSFFAFFPRRGEPFAGRKGGGGGRKDRVARPGGPSGKPKIGVSFPFGISVHRTFVSAFASSVRPVNSFIPVGSSPDTDRFVPSSVSERHSFFDARQGIRDGERKS